MRLSLICIGRAKAGAERDLATRYLDRAQAAGRGVGLSIDVRDIDESRARRPEDRKTDEAKAILGEYGSGLSIAFDERGRAVDSVTFASMIGDARDQGASELTIIVGGPDGLDTSIRERATHVVAFGAMTWPHQLVRIMVAEQIYRAITILAGHPYHRV